MDDVTRFIEDVKTVGTGIDAVRAKGDSYGLHLIVAKAFEGAVPYVDDDGEHVVTRVGNDLYGAYGKIGSVGRRSTEAYHRMTDAERKSFEEMHAGGLTACITA